MKSRFILILAGLMLLLFSYSSAQVPQLINYQGKLTKSTGAPLDTTVQMIFSIYADSNGTILNWTETQATVKVEKGIFNVLLGSVTPISSSVFDGSVRYLGVKVGADPEITPRKPMVSVPYAYRAGSIQTNCHDCDSIFVNVAGPDSVYSSSGTAFKGSALGNSTSEMIGLKGYADNTSGGLAFGGLFETSSSGTGDHYGVRARAYSSDPGYAYGSYGYAANTNGGAVGGFFDAVGTSYTYGIYADGSGSSSYYPVYGSYVSASNSTGAACGGYFNTGGGGYVYGVQISSGSVSSPNPVYGCYASAYNSSTGAVYGGYFSAGTTGTGTKYGVYASSSLGYAGYFSGNLTATGTKSAAVKVDNGEYRLLYCQESPENWFEDFGGGTLQNGATTIQIDPLFTQTVNTQIEYRVFLTPEGDCKGLYVTNKTANSFEVRELQSGNSNISFSYRIVAKRKGYENLRLAKMGGPTPEEVASEQTKHQEEMEKERLKQEGDRKQMSEQQVKIDKEIR